MTRIEMTGLRRASSRLTALALATLGAAALAGCTTTGAGAGQSPGGKVDATFTWKSEGGYGGTMTANLSNGETFRGQFFQVTQQSTIDSFAPLWVGWSGLGGWDGWDDWDPGPDFVTKYTGKVLANLQGPKGYMRCRFTLAYPTGGMSGGGIGRCQLPSGVIIDAEFPQS